MASITTAQANSLLDHLLNNVAWPYIGDAPGLLASATNGNLYLSLHTADPGSGGAQNASEAAYGGYARITVARNPASKQWTIASGAATNANPLSWPIVVSGSETETYVGLGTDSTGAGHLIFRFQITSPGGGLIVNAGITPQVLAGGLTETIA